MPPKYERDHFEAAPSSQTAKGPNRLQILKLPRLSSGVWETVHNIGWVTTARVIRMGGSLVVGTMVVRYLGPAQFGTFSYAMAVYGLFNVISALGLDYLVVNEVAVARELGTEEEVLGTALLLKAAASLVTTAAAILFAWLTHPGQHVVLLIVAMLSVASIFQGFDVVDYYFQAKIRSRLTVIPQLIVFALSNLARLFAVIFKCPLLVFGAIAALEIFLTEVGFAVTYWIAQRNLSRWSFSRNKAVSLLRASWPLLIASLLIIVYMRTDQILLGNLSTQTVVGQYSAASKLSEIWYAIPALICTSVMPKLLVSRQADTLLYYARLGRLYQIMAVISISIAVLVSLLGKYLVVLFFGARYLPSAGILSVLIWTGPFVFVGVVSSMQLIAGALCNVGLNYLLIPRFGGIGSACATLITQMLSSYLLDAFDRRTRHIFWMKTRALTGAWAFTHTRASGPELGSV
jgi:PST family polysaccharide transporter